MTNREQILRNTSALFLERGCKSLTMDDVASANGMSKRTLYEMFHDKAGLLRKCILLMHKDNMTRSEEELAKSGNVLEWFMRSLENKDEKRMSFYYDFFTEVKRYYPEVFMNVVQDVNRWCEQMALRAAGESNQAGTEGRSVHNGYPGRASVVPAALRAFRGGYGQGGAQLSGDQA